jgi:hypothetical protein
MINLYLIEIILYLKEGTTANARAGQHGRRMSNTSINSSTDPESDVNFNKQRRLMKPRGQGEPDRRSRLPLNPACKNKAAISNGHLKDEHALLL